MSQLSSTGGISTEDIYTRLKDDKELQISNKISYSHPSKTEGKAKKMSLGRIWFNTLMPDDFRLINEPVTKPVMNKIMGEIIEKYPPDKASDVVSNIQEQAFRMAVFNPKSFDIDTFIPSAEWVKSKEEFTKKADTLSDQEFIKEAAKLTKSLLKEIESKGSGIQDVLNSGTKGGIADWQALMVSRGFVIDVEGNISRITEANNDGYSIESYYKGGAQARSNYYTKSIMTQKPGYLARKITSANANVKLTGTDCKTKKYLEIVVSSDKAEGFMGRYYLKGTKLALVESVDDIIGKRISFRSPMYCKQKDGICPICYGKLSHNLGNKNIGILAGGAVNMEAVNVMMKSRHKATQVEIIDVDFVKMTKHANVDYKTLSRIFNIEKKKILANVDLEIHLNKKDYNDESLVDVGDHFILPGIIDVRIGKGEDVEIFTLPYNFKVNLWKPEDTDSSGTAIVLRYTKGEIILSKEQYMTELNAALMDKLFEGGAKYITDPEILLDVIAQELPKTDSVHLELIVANMFRSADEPTIPSRLNGYKNPKIFGNKLLPFIDSWLSALAFEHINKAIKVGLIKDKDATFNPIEKIIIDKYYAEDVQS